MKVNKYRELQKKHERLINEFPMAFAFGEQQLQEALIKLKVTDKNEVCSTKYGGIIRKTDKEAYYNLLDKMDAEEQEARKDDEYLYDGFLYELGNHEYCITFQLYDILPYFDISFKDFDTNERYQRIMTKAIKHYLKNCNY